jgi:ABC-2 type transport system permease protein
MSDSQSAAPMSIAQQDGLQPLNEQRLHKNSGWRLYLQTVFARAYPRLIGQQREKSWLFFDILMPLLSVFAYVFAPISLVRPKTILDCRRRWGDDRLMNVLWSMSSQLYWKRNRASALYIITRLR